MGTGLELHLRRKDGSTLPVEVCLGRRRVNGQDHVIASVRDITERRRLEESLRQATAAMERAYERIRRDVEAAAKLQQQLLPAQLPAAAGIRFARGYRPCAGLGGDGLNIFRLDEDHVGLYLLDVSGHGVAAALLAVTLVRLLSPAHDQASLLRVPLAEGQGYRILGPAEVARRLNQWLLANPAGEQYFTLLYGVLEVSSRRLRYVSAGHPGMLHAPAHSEPTLLSVPGLPIGWVPDADFEETNLQLRAGDRLFLYSDGLTEATGRAGDPFGVPRLKRAIAAANGQPLEVCTRRLVGEVLQWSEAEPQDDLSVVALAVE
jgi:sigma-B regulation protein RsbU (phosphoserine phosphatase)